ncbi:phosphoesterase [Candidatus Kaiserbacteria bacterium]|nr:MAG: phosphoesterase [Candidatus Kaiserbacteria bacterium]
MNHQVIAIYHKDCIDGTSAASVVLRKFPNAALFPLAHSYTDEDIKPILDLASPDAEIYTVDCGIGIKEFLDRGYSVTTIDHHIGSKSLFEDMERQYENYSYIFNNDKSGASLAWAFLFPYETEPELIKYVEDVDLWNWKFGDDSKYINNYLSIFRNDPVTMLSLLEGDLSDVMRKGRTISEYTDKEIEDLVKIKPIQIKIGDHIVPSYNISSYQSECGNILSGNLNKTVAMFTINGQQVKVSFRSKEGQSPTSLELAQLLGGGGHKLASGAGIKLVDFLKLFV